MRLLLQVQHALLDAGTALATSGSPSSSLHHSLHSSHSVGPGKCASCICTVFVQKAASFGSGLDFTSRRQSRPLWPALGWCADKLGKGVHKVNRNVGMRVGRDGQCREAANPMHGSGAMLSGGGSVVAAAAYLALPFLPEPTIVTLTVPPHLQHLQILISSAVLKQPACSSTCLCARKVQPHGAPVCNDNSNFAYR